MFDGLFPCNVIGHIGKLGEVGLVKGMIHGNDLVDAQALALNVGKAAALQPLVVSKHPPCPILRTNGVSAVILIRNDPA